MYLVYKQDNNGLGLVIACGPFFYLILGGYYSQSLLWGSYAGQVLSHLSLNGLGLAFFRLINYNAFTYS